MEVVSLLLRTVVGRRRCVNGDVLHLRVRANLILMLVVVVVVVMLMLMLVVGVENGILREMGRGANGAHS